MQSQLACTGCRRILLYPSGATIVCCALCSSITSVPAPASNQLAYVNCGNCHTVLMYPCGAPSVKCAVCHFITNINMGNARVPFPMHRPNGTTAPAPMSSASKAMPTKSHSQTVVVENPMSVDASGKLVSNVVVGITTEKR
ncbi:protein LSD1-like [Diospyros lotus]|uniref:protein LSD1-like n=1 Tax=Diospyros lotus TaxID=55363 RepID=UPI00224D9BDF|nr:protein LSD1-like [Diospyros lotus]